MKSSLHARIGFAVGALLVMGALALAQSKPSSKRAHPDKAAGKQSARVQDQSGQAKSLAVDHAGGNGVRRADSGNSAGDRSGRAKMHRKKSLDRDGAGENPFYESKDKSVSKSTAGASKTRKHKHS